MNRMKKLSKKLGLGFAMAAMSMSMASTVALAADEHYDGVNTSDGTNSLVYGDENDDVHVIKAYTFKDDQQNNIEVAVPSAKDRCSIRVYGVTNDAKEQATVKAYRIIAANYNEYGFTGWTQTAWSAGIGDEAKMASFENVTNNKSQVVVEIDDEDDDNYNGNLVITEQNISTIAQAVVEGDVDVAETDAIDLEYDRNLNCFKNTAARPGTYLVLVTSSNGGTVYNPMIVSNDYSNSNISNSLSNVTQTARPGTKTAMATTESYRDAAFTSQRGVGGELDPDNRGSFQTNEFKDYSLTLDAEIFNKTAYTGINKDLDPIDQISDDDADAYAEARQQLVYHRDIEAQGQVFAVDGAIDANGKFTPVTDANGYDTTSKTMALLGRAYAKKSRIGIEKNIINASTTVNRLEQVDTPDAATLLGYSKFDDVSEGDTVSFDLMTMVPDYSETYFGNTENFTFKIVDSQCAALAAVEAGNVEVYAAHSDKLTAAEIAADIVKEENKLTNGAEYVFSDASDASDDDNAFAIDFSKDWIIDAENANKKVIVRYSTTVTETAKLGLVGNLNKVYLDFTTTPGEDKPENHGYKFDFAIQYSFNSTAVKIDENGDVTVTEGDTTYDYNTVEDIDALKAQLEVEKPLSGAKFKLSRIGDRWGAIEQDEAWNTAAVAEGISAKDRKYPDGYQTWYMTSDENGFINFDSEKDGIDEGLYALVEYEAPDGYTLNDRIYYIKITPQYDEALKQFVGTDIRLATEGVYAIEGMTFLDGTKYGDPVNQNSISAFERATRIIDNYTVAQWNSANTTETGTTDLTINPQDDPNKVVEGADAVVAKFFWKTENNDGQEDGDKRDATVAAVDAAVIAIPNTKLAKLPSTGGVGTILFTMAGVMLMGGAVAGSAFMKKKREDEA